MKTDRKKKSLMTGISLTLCAALMLSGTLAWSSIKQTAKNEIIGGKLRNPGGRLHDDFDGNTGDKNIYVENFTGMLDGQDIIVRVRLREYEAIGKENVEEVKNQDENWETTWDVFNLNDSDEEAHFGHWNWQMGGDTVYMPTFNKNKDSIKSDLNGTYDGTSADDDIHFDDFKSYTVGETKTDNAIYDDDDDNDDEDENIKEVEETHTAASTINGTVYTLEEWEALDEENKTGDFWVYGDDGWAYWANPLKPATATAPLLNAIGMDPANPINDEWYYGIYVESEMVTADEISADAKENQTGFYHEHTGEGDCEDCAGECPSETMYGLLEKIAEKCSEDTTSGPILNEDEILGKDVAVSLSKTRTSKAAVKELNLSEETEAVEVPENSTEQTTETPENDQNSEPEDTTDEKSENEQTPVAELPSDETLAIEEPGI